MSMTHRLNFSASDRRQFLADVPSLSPRRVALEFFAVLPQPATGEIKSTYCVVDLLFFRLFFLYPPPSAPFFSQRDEKNNLNLSVDIYLDTTWNPLRRKLPGSTTGWIDIIVINNNKLSKFD
jgi:hypothetical protein